MIVACLIKEIQVSTELRKMADIHLVPQQTIDDLIMKKFNAPLRRKPDDDDPVSENSNLDIRNGLHAVLRSLNFQLIVQSPKIGPRYMPSPS